jgi:hypothetical protein
MNLVRNHHANAEAALRRVFPQATKVGVGILREAGWTTQIPSVPEVAVPQPGPIYAVEGFAVDEHDLTDAGYARLYDHQNLRLDQQRKSHPNRIRWEA